MRRQRARKFDSCISLEKENKLRLQLLLEKLENILRQRFHQHFPVDPLKLYHELLQHKKSLKKIFRKDQLDLVFPECGLTNTETFDLAILVTLLLELCCDEIPDRNWNPDTNDNSDKASFVRSRIVRNLIQHLSSTLSKAEFDDLVEKVKKPLIDLGCSQQEIDEVLNISIDRKLQERFDKMERSHEEFSYNFIRPVANFIGRDEEIEQIHQHLVSSRSTSDRYGVVVSGMAGVGKTEIVRKYWINYNTFYDDRIIWINAQSKDSIETDFINIAKRAGLTVTEPDNKSLKPIDQIVYMTYWHFARRQSGQKERKVLFVFDNAVNAEDIDEFLPSYNIEPYMIITSQYRGWDTQRFDISHVDVLSNNIAEEFLVNNLDVGYRNNPSFDKELLLLLECHPLAMQQAVSYIKVSDIDVHTYVNLLKNADWSKLADQVPNKSIRTQSVFKTFLLALEHLESDEDASRLLKIMAYLDGRCIERDLLQKLCNNDFLTMNSIVTKLNSYSLIDMPSYDKSVPSGLGIVTMHSLVKLTILSLKADEERDERTTDYLGELLETVFVDLTSDRVGYLTMYLFLYLYEQSETKTKLLQKYVNTGGIDVNMLINIFGIPKKWLEVMKSIERIIPETYDDNHPLVLQVKVNIAFCLNHLGKSEDALKLLYKVHKTLGIDHPDTLETENNIATCLYKLGKFDKALKLFYKVHKTRSTTLGSDHPVTLATENNIASCLLHLGKFEGALKSFCEVHKKQSKTLGRDHLHTLTTENNMASCLLYLGEFEDALKSFYEVHETRSSTLGSDHPDTLGTENNIAACLYKLGKFDEALKLFYKVHKTLSMTLGSDHLHTLTTENSITTCLQSIGKLENALERYYIIYISLLTRLGNDHPLTISILCNIVICLLLS